MLELQNWPTSMMMNHRAGMVFAIDHDYPSRQSSCHRFDRKFVDERGVRLASIRLKDVAKGKTSGARLQDEKQQFLQ